MTRCRHRDGLVLANNVRKHVTQRRIGSEEAAVPVLLADTQADTSDLPVAIPDVDTDDSLFLPSTSVPPAPVLLADTQADTSDLPVSIPDVGTDESLYLPSTSVPPDPVNRRMRQRGRVDYSQFF